MERELENLCDPVFPSIRSDWTVVRAILTHLDSIWGHFDPILTHFEPFWATVTYFEAF